MNHLNSIRENHPKKQWPRKQDISNAQRKTEIQVQYLKAHPMLQHTAIIIPTLKRTQTVPFNRVENKQSMHASKRSIKLSGSFSQKSSIPGVIADH